MKMTLEITGAIRRAAKSAAAKQGIPLSRFIAEAVKEKLTTKAPTRERPWMEAFGKLSHLSRETV